jgi:uncharacterized membrane protein YfcA
VTDIAALVLVGLVAGTLAAALGLGGGVIYVTALVVFFGFAQQEAQGTSLAVILPTAIVGTIAHHQRRRVVWKSAAAVGAGGIVGAVIGARIALMLDPAVLRRMFATLLVVLIIQLLRRTFRRT